MVGVPALVFSGLWNKRAGRAPLRIAIRHGLTVDTALSPVF
ncbi:hypothetical protein [Methanoregula sp.]|nr:hypothetical protein [Methanoregula sp.]